MNGQMGFEVKMGKYADEITEIGDLTIILFKIAQKKVYKKLFLIYNLHPLN